MCDQGNSAHSEKEPRRGVKCRVKWFNTTKGFGFVEPLDGTSDAFVHISVLEPMNMQGLPEGAAIICDLQAGERGLQVLKILDLGPAPVLTKANAEGEFVEGTVKFFNSQKGFGFVVRDDGGPDIFVHMKALEKSGLGTLETAQRVRLNVSSGEKGPLAEGVQIISD
jgi:CspA family cold shock protein